MAERVPSKLKTTSSILAIRSKQASAKPRQINVKTAEGEPPMFCVAISYTRRDTFL